MNTWLEGERSIAFCKLLGQNTAKLKPNDIPHRKIKIWASCIQSVKMEFYNLFLDIGKYICYIFSAAETWPFLITLLTQCASMEVSLSKRRLPKLIFAKTLRIVVQRAQGSKFSGIYWINSCFYVSSSLFKLCHRRRNIHVIHFNILGCGEYLVHQCQTFLLYRHSWWVIIQLNIWMIRSYWIILHGLNT